MPGPSQKYPTPVPLEWAAVPLPTSAERIQDGWQAGPPPTGSPGPLPAAASENKSTKPGRSKAPPARARAQAQVPARQAGFAHCSPTRPPLLPLRAPSSPFPWTPLRLLPSRYLLSSLGCLEEDAVMSTAPTGYPTGLGCPSPLPGSLQLTRPGPFPTTCRLDPETGRGVSHQPHAGLEGAHLGACSKSCNNPSPLISPPPPRKGGRGPSPARQAPHKYIFMASCVVGQ